MSAYLDGDLRTLGRARLDRHIAECRECRAVLGSLRQMLGVLHRLPPQADTDVPDIAGTVLRRLRE